MTIDFEEMSRCWMESSWVDVEGKLVIPADWTCCHGLMKIRKAMKGVAKSKGELFRKPDTVRKGRRGVVATKVGRDLEFCLGIDVSQISASFPQHRLDPYFHLFSETYRASQLWRGDFSRYNVDALNLLVRDLRVAIKRRGFTKEVNKHECSALKNAKTVKQDFDTMYRNYGKILHVRINLYYELTWPRPEIFPLTAVEMKAQRARIMRHVRKTFPAVIGHLWTFSYDEMKGPNFHLIVHFKGHKAEGVEIAHKIGEHWREVITNGHGRFLNFHKYEEQFDEQGKRGLGLISHSDRKRRNNLLQAALSLVNSDIFARVVMPGFGKTFGRGRFRPRKKSNAGRKKKGYRLRAGIEAISARRGLSRRP